MLRGVAERPGAPRRGAGEDDGEDEDGLSSCSEASAVLRAKLVEMPTAGKVESVPTYLEQPRQRLRRPRDKGDTVGECLVFGDSQAWGMRDDAFLRCRRPWPLRIKSRLLAKGFRLVQSNFPERTTAYDDHPEHNGWWAPNDPPAYNGLDHFRVVFSSHTAVWLVVALGLHDLKARVRERALNELRQSIAFQQHFGTIVQEQRREMLRHTQQTAAAAAAEQAADGCATKGTPLIIRPKPVKPEPQNSRERFVIGSSGVIDLTSDNDEDLDAGKASTSSAATMFKRSPSSGGRDTPVATWATPEPPLTPGLTSGEEDESEANLESRTDSKRRISDDDDDKDDTKPSKRRVLSALEAELARVNSSPFHGDVAKLIGTPSPRGSAARPRMCSTSSASPGSVAEPVFSADLVAKKAAAIGLKAREMFTGHCHVGDLHVALVPPPPIQLTEVGRKLGFDKESVRLSQGLRAAFKRVCDEHDFLLAEEPWIDMRESVDGLHFNTGQHEAMAEAVWRTLLSRMPREVRQPQRTYFDAKGTLGETGQGSDIKSG